MESIKNPRHYTQGNIECIDAIHSALGHEEFLSYCQGNVIKYVSRHKYKGKALQDLKKARWYIDRMIQELEENESR